MKLNIAVVTFCCMFSSLSFADYAEVEKCRQALASQDDSVSAMVPCKAVADKGDKLGHFYYAMTILLEHLPFKTEMHSDEGWFESPTVTLTEQDIQWIREMEKQLKQSGTKGFDEAYYQLGVLLVHTKDVKALNNGSSKKRHKKALFYFINAADNNNKSAIAALSQYIKSKMVDGKIPLRFSHLTDYAQMDWTQKGEKKEHHYAAYERWLEQVQQTRKDPQKADVKLLTQMAKDYENGYFLGENVEEAIKLYQIAAKKGDAFSQFKSGELLLDSKPIVAFEYLQQSAANQWPDAMLRLGDHYGCLGKKDQALQWYEKALVLGNENAADEKASMLETGKPTQCN